MGRAKIYIDTAAEPDKDLTKDDPRQNNKQRISQMANESPVKVLSADEYLEVSSSRIDASCLCFAAAIDRLPC